MMDIVLVNKRMGNNNLRLVHYIICDTQALAEETHALLKQAKKRIPDDSVMERLCHSQVRNMWKLATALYTQDKVLLKVRIADEAPDATEWLGKPVADCNLVINDTPYTEGLY